jgi:hypothetical protein
MKLTQSYDINAYLTEAKLCDIVAKIYPEHTKIFGKYMLGFRPDIYIPELSTIIEYDGYTHYGNAKSVLRDERRDAVFADNGIKTLRIPYFIQLTTETVKEYLQVDYEFEQVYPHGFIDDKVILPSNFSELGIDRFLNDMERVSYLKDDVRASLERKIEIHGDERLVVTSKIKHYFGI